MGLYIDIVLLIIQYWYLNIEKSGASADIEEGEHIDKYQYIIDISINLNMISLTYHA